MSSYSVVASGGGSKNDGDDDEDYNTQCRARQRPRPQPRPRHRLRAEAIDKGDFHMYGNSTNKQTNFDDVVKHAGAPGA